METVSRRSVMGIAAGGIAAGVLAGKVIAAETALPGGSNEKQKAKSEHVGSGKTDSVYKYSMAKAHARHYGASSVREHKLDDFPMSASMSATLLTLAPGDVREPH